MRLLVGTLLIGLVLLFVPIRVKSKIGYNLFQNQGYLSVFFFNFKIFLAKWKVFPTHIQIKLKSKTMKIYFNSYQAQTNFGDIYISNLIKKVKIKNLRIIASFGFNADQLISVLCGAGLDIILKIIYCVLLSKKSSDKLDIKVFTSAKKTCFIMCGTTSIQFNLMILLTCFIKTVFRKINISFKKVTNR